jgi:sugar/nucleoside kinase (ribokinase family)
MNRDISKYRDYLHNLSGQVLLGCDGFVDEVYRIVDVRQSLTEFTGMDDMKRFGQLVADRSGGGLGLEIVPKRRCSGGFTPNTGRVLAFLGVKPTLVGLYGRDKIDPAFDEFRDNCRLVSLGDSAVTLVFEFSNGKVLLSDLKSVANFTWKDFAASFPGKALTELFTGVDIVGLGYWSLTPDFDNFLKGIVSNYRDITPPKRMFFDFADIKKKSKESLLASLALIREFNKSIPMTMSLNEHEGADLLSKFDLKCPEEPAALVSALTTVRKEIGIDELVIHTPHFAVGTNTTEGEGTVLQDFQAKVIRTAGAGDSFNGGYVAASLGHLTLQERLVIANAATSFFVTHATAPTKAEMLEQIEKALVKA